jgi:hypothetical protein
MVALQLALLLLQGETGDPPPIAIARLFIGFFLVLFIVSGATLFTYWISKDE